ncbi:ATP-binding protein [Paractinoplanes lichenicola]|uniref:ATP-binding protein n=1 Tax=Paractinoplanes lichenicola TaxID=2802976 RepID=A0ABS1VV11_9ACTN|nr:ATP-binding protein [Actinoplanes lichenicola]MBL7258306.1 ATP-binding protein [Actinoplanes lichenicola]
MSGDSFQTSYAEPGDLAQVREFVRSHAAGLGLPEERAELLTLAVSELATNTLQHTAGGGTVRLWSTDGRVICDVTDGGPIRTLGREMPAAGALRGRGLAIVERICDEVAVDTAGDSTRVRLALDLESGPTAGR